MAKLNLTRFSSIYVVMILIGSQFVGTIGSILRVNTQALLWMTNILILICALFFILNGVRNNRSVFNIGFPFIAYFSLFLIRMFIDLVFNKVFTSTFPSPITYFIYALGICFLFAYAIKYLDNIDFNFVSKWFYILLLLMTGLSIIYNSVLGMGQSSQTRNTGAENIGALTYGHLGVSLFLISLHYLLNSKEISKKIWFIISMSVGLLVMYLASSRSPLVALILCSLFYLGVNRGMMKGVVIFVLLLSPMYIFWDNILSFLSNFHGDFIYRIMLAIESGDSSGRDVIYDQALSQFWKNPIFGDSFLLRSGEFTGLYPHNLIMESLMATGIIGTIFLVIWLVRLLRKCYSVVRSRSPYAWIPLLFLQYLIFGMSSKSIYTNNNLWYFGFLLLYLFYHEVKLQNKEN